METFDKPYWSRRQVELWVCIRSRDALRLADYDFGDLRLGPAGIDDERYDDDDSPIFDEGELYCTAIIRYDSVCSRDDARKEVVVALSEGEIRAYPNPDGNSDDQFFERAKVLKLWPEAETQRQEQECAPPTRGKHSQKPISDDELKRWFLRRMQERKAHGLPYYSRDEERRGHVPGGGVGAVGRWPAGATARSLA
jgi:hypothetical protein